jgi:molecular chaperone DnaJ
MSTDYYKILEINKNASQDEIKAAYKKLALKYHPDKNNGKDDMFKSISEAYTTLSDEQKRKQYDNPHQHPQNQFFNGMNGGGMGGMSFGFNFNFQMPQVNKTNLQKAKKYPDINIILPITLEESFFGFEKIVVIDQPNYCICSISCPHCNGVGHVQLIQNLGILKHTINVACNQCLTKGYIFDAKCENCGGSGKNIVKKSIKIVSPPGTEDSVTLKLEKGGDQPLKDSIHTPGDIIIKISIDKHPIFTRDKLNLKFNTSINLIDSICGTDISIPLFNDINYKINTSIFGTIYPLKEYNIKEKGFSDPTNPSKKGDLIITFDVIDPNLNIKQKTQLKSYFENVITKLNTKEYTEDIDDNELQNLLNKYLKLNKEEKDVSTIIQSSL